MTEPKRRGRPAKAAVAPVEVPSVDATPTKGALTVKVADMIHDGLGGFLPVGHKFDAADGESLKAKGLAE